MRKRADALKPFYDSLQSSIASAESRALFPPFGNFLMFDSVKTLYEPEDADQSPTALAAARNSIMDDANRFAAEIKSVFYSQLVKAHNEAGTPLARDQAGAATLSQTAVEQLAKRVESAVKCPSVWCTTYMTFPAVLDHYKVCGSQPLTADSLSASAARILATKHVIAVVNAVEPDRFKDDPPSTTTLYALGTAFKCDDCKSRDGAVGPAIWSGRYQGSARWSGMVRSRSCEDMMGTLKTFPLGPQVQHILDKHTQPTFALPTVEYTPPAPPSPGQDNPGGFVVEDDG